MSIKVPFTYKIVGDGGWLSKSSREDITRFNLTKDGSSWIDVFYLPEELFLSPEAFREVWNLHPKAKGKIKIMGKELETPRWQQSYLRGYWFSGMNHSAIPLPKEVKPYFDLANSSGYELWPGKPVQFNEALLNWYQDGSMYIGPHSDDERHLVSSPKGETLVWSLSLQEDGSRRIFRLKPKTGGKDRLDIGLENGMVVVMGGRCQKTHKHQVPKDRSRGKRVNITFRVFKE